VHFPFTPGSRLSRLRRRPENGQPAGHQHQQHHCPDLCDWRRPGRRGRRIAGHAIRGDQPLSGLPRWDQSIHRRGTRRYRQHSRCGTGRPGTGCGGSHWRRYLWRSIQRRGGLQPAGAGAAVPSDRDSRPSGGGKGMSRNLKTAIFSTVLLLLISYPLLGLKLSVIGIGLQVEGASPRTLWTIAIAAALVFVWQLFRDRLPGSGRFTALLPSMPSSVTHRLTLPSTQRWIIMLLVVVALV